MPFRAIFEQNIGLEHIHCIKHEKVNDFVENLNSCEFLEGLSCYQPFVQVQALNPTAASLEELRNFPFANDDATIANLAQELPLYLAASDGVTCSNM